MISNYITELYRDFDIINYIVEGVECTVPSVSRRGILIEVEAIKERLTTTIPLPVSPKKLIELGTTIRIASVTT